MEKLARAAAFLFLSLASVLAILPAIAEFAATAIARIALKPENYAVYVHSIDPLWSGMDPQARAPIYRFWHYKRRYIRFCARLLGGVPAEPPALEPKHRKPRTPMKIK